VSDPAGARDEPVSLRLTRDGESDAGHLHVTGIGPGEDGRTPGIEFIGHQLLPPSLATIRLPR
jgi:hypothetical protein